MTPKEFNFPDSYRKSGLKSFRMKLSNRVTGLPLNLIGSTVKMWMVSTGNEPAYIFSSDLEGEHKLTVLPDGVIEFPLISSWDIPPTTYKYDLKITDNTGFVLYYLKGTWAVKKNITDG